VMVVTGIGNPSGTSIMRDWIKAPFY